MSVVERVAPSDNEEETLEKLHNLFNEQGYSDYVVVYLRLITSGQLQEGADFYQNFIDGNCTMEEFRHREVEPMYKESDHIHIIGNITISFMIINHTHILLPKNTGENCVILLVILFYRSKYHFGRFFGFK